MRIIPSHRSLLFTFVMLVVAAASFAQIGVSISVAPPMIPVYRQPLCPGEGYLWTPGYWAYGENDYYWVPGTWVMAPEVGLLWTPGYWGWGNGGYAFNEGYWGPQVGFYGGVSYGFGYFGEGYQGGRWDNGHFFYNRSVNNVNVTNIHNPYNTTVINHGSRVSYNGGRGGITARPSAHDEAASRERHVPPTSAQNEHQQGARSNPELRASSNHGKPRIAATSKPGAFNERASAPANHGGATNHSAANHSAASHSVARSEGKLTSGKSAGARPMENTHASHEAKSAPRTSGSEHTAAATHHEATHEPSSAHKSNPARTEKAQHTQAAARPEKTLHPAAAARTEKAPHTEATARPEKAPHTEAAAKPEKRNQPK